MSGHYRIGFERLRYAHNACCSSLAKFFENGTLVAEPLLQYSAIGVYEISSYALFNVSRYFRLNVGISAQIVTSQLSTARN